MKWDNGISGWNFLFSNFLCKFGVSYPGGGFALSDAAEVSGLSDWLGAQLNGLEVLDERLILIIVMIMTAFVTEIASNTACANVIIPILLALVRVTTFK